MKRSFFFVFFAVLLTQCVYAETHISGDIKTQILESTGNPYIVDQDIVVPAGKRLTIREGCVLVFKGFTGLNVYGHLTVAGTTKQPVIFTSINDGDYNPKSEQLANPFDWNGILIAKEASGAAFQNFHLRFSVYGIKSQNMAITIINGLFKQNGQFHFTINDKIQYVQDNLSFSYNGTPNSDNTVQKSSKNNETANEAPLVSSDIKTKKNKEILRFASLGIGVVGLVAGTVCLMQWLPLDKDLKLSHQDFIAKYPNDQADKFKTLSNTANGFAAGMGIGYGLGVLGIAGFALTFVF